MCNIEFVPVDVDVPGQSSFRKLYHCKVFQTNHLLNLNEFLITEEFKLKSKKERTIQEFYKNI